MCNCDQETISDHFVAIDSDFGICYGELIETFLASIEAIAKEEDIPSAVNGGVVKGNYCIYKLDVPWLTPRIGGKFKLAIDENERQGITLVVQ